MKLNPADQGYLKAIALLYSIAPRESDEELATIWLWCSAAKRLGLTSDQAEEFLNAVLTEDERERAPT